MEMLLANPNVCKFVDWVRKKDPDFTTTTAKNNAELAAAAALSHPADIVLFGERAVAFRNGLSPLE